MRRQVIPFVLFMSTFPLSASAQTVTGSIRGRAMDPSGHPDEGVEVVVSGPGLPRPRTVVTDRDGYFVVVGVPDGEYGVRLSRMGLRTVAVKDVDVQIGRTTSIGPVTLDPEPVRLDPVVVEAPRNAVDPVHTTVGANLDVTDFEALPTGRDYRDLLTILPHANESFRGDRVNVAGSTGLENQYFIDGVNVTSPFDATAGTSLPYNFVRGVELKEGGFEAQYGQALGAVVNAVTWTGTNDFEGEAFAFTTPGELSAQPKPTGALQESNPLTYDLGARFSGPVLRDRLWYSAAFNSQIVRSTKDITGVGPHIDRSTSHRFAGKLTWAATPKVSLNLSLFGDPTTRHRVGVNWVRGASGVDAGPFLHVQNSGSVTGVLRTEATLDRRLLLETTLAYTSGHQSEKGEPSSSVEQMFFYDAASNGVSGGAGEWQTIDDTRTTLRLKATWSPERHTVIGGVEYEDNGVFRDYWADIAAAYPGFYYRDNESGRGKVHNRVPTLYLQDAWRLTDHLTVSPGMRWSGQYLIGASGETAQTFLDQWQPRLGFSWLLGTAERQRIFGSYGRFYEQSPLFVAANYYVDYSVLERFYTDDPRSLGAQAVDSLDSSWTEQTYTTPIPDVQLDNLDELTLGYEHTFGGGTRLTFRGIRRSLRSSFGFGREASGRFILGTPGKGDLYFLPAPSREYRALEVSADGSLGELRYRASYVLSRTRGNYVGLYAEDQGEVAPGQPLSLFDSAQAVNSTGLLPQDRPHVFKLSGAYPTAFGLTAGAFLTLASGTPVNEFGSVVRTPEFLVPRGSAGRTPWTWDVNLRLTWEPSFLRQNTQLVVDLMHVGNPQRAVWLDEWHYLGEDPDTGAQIDENPNYLQPIAYQPPAAIRLGVEVRF